MKKNWQLVISCELLQVLTWVNEPIVSQSVSLFRKVLELITVHQRTVPLLIFHRVYGPLSGGALLCRFVPHHRPLLLPFLSLSVSNSFYLFLSLVALSLSFQRQISSKLCKSMSRDSDIFLEKFISN